MSQKAEIPEVVDPAIRARSWDELTTDLRTRLQKILQLGRWPQRLYLQLVALNVLTPSEEAEFKTLQQEYQQEIRIFTGLQYSLAGAATGKPFDSAQIVSILNGGDKRERVTIRLLTLVNRTWRRTER